MARTLALPFLIAPSTALASLGGTAASVDADRVRTQGALMRIVESNAYALHEIRSASGALVREYVSSSGTVIAVAWDGPWLPDLRQVLGDHFDQYQSIRDEAARSAREKGAARLPSICPGSWCR